MKNFFCLLTMGWMVALGSVRAAGKADIREMQIDPSTTRVAAIGKARLSIETLKHEGGGFQGPYRVDVTMLPVGSEAGQLTITLSDADLDKLAGGTAIQFTGQAVSKDGNHSDVRGTATPSAGDGGAIRVHVDSKKGKLVFNTKYRLVR